MKTILFAVVLGLTFSMVNAEDVATSQTQAGTPVPPSETKSDIKLKVRFEEKVDKKTNKRIAVVYVKNEGMKDIDKQEATVVLRGKGENEKQEQKITLNAPKNREIKIEVEIIAYVEGSNGEGFVGANSGNVIAVQKTVGVAVTVGDQSFKS